MPYHDKEFYASREMTMTADEVTLSDHPEIMGDVVYRFDFRAVGSPRDLEVEITDVEVEDIKNPVYDEDGNQMILSEDDKQKFIPRAYQYFWKRLLDHAEKKALDHIQWGPL
jgi:hypothetical protein